MTRSIWPWLKLLAGAGILGAVFWRLGAGAVTEGLRGLGADALLAAFAIGVATTLLSAWRWRLVARGLGMRLSMRSATADYYQALFLNAALPGGILGDVDRALRHGRDAGDVGRSLRAVALERMAGQLVLLAVGAALLLSLPSPVSGVVAGAAPVAAAVALLALAALVALRRRRLVTELRAALLSRRNGPGVLLASVIILAGHLATFLVAARAAGAAAPVALLAPLLLLALLAMALPLNVGGWGPREGVLAWAFGAAGLSAAQGLTVAVIYGVLAFVAASPGAIIVAVRAVRRLRAVAADQVRATPAPVSSEAVAGRLVPVACPGGQVSAALPAAPVSVAPPSSPAPAAPESVAPPSSPAPAATASERPIPARPAPHRPAPIPSAPPTRTRRPGDNRPASGPAARPSHAPIPVAAPAPQRVRPDVPARSGRPA